MKVNICRSITANKELQTAKNMYETRTTARNKRKIEEMEDMVKKEEAQRTEDDIAGEVNSLLDPGTASKWAT